MGEEAHPAVAAAGLVKDVTETSWWEGSGDTPLSTHWVQKRYTARLEVDSEAMEDAAAEKEGEEACDRPA